MMGLWSEVERSSILENLPAMGGAHRVDWETRRECGCLVRIGTRLDKMEGTLTVAGCDDHLDEMARALFVFGHTEPSDWDAIDLMCGFLEREIDGEEPDA